MNPFVTLRVAARALWRNKMRSFLTTLGVVIGVASVIAMVAIGEGAKARVADTFAAMGSNLIIVMPGSTQASGARGGFGSMPTLTWDDLKAIRNEVPTARFVSEQLQSGVQVASEDQNWQTRASGVAPEFFDIRSWNVSRGAKFTQSDVDAGAKVVVLGQTVVEKLFGPSADPVGTVVRIRNVPFTVVGVLDKKGQSPMGQDYDDAVIIPTTTYREKIEGGLKNFVKGVILVSATGPDVTSRLESQISNLLRDRHHIGPGQDDDFSIRNLAEMADAQQEGTRTMTALLASVAFVSLVVGGIGIMNIMLVSVTERTREIGVRMAVGAKPSHIRAQFLVEALSLSIAGGLMGVALGLGAGWWIATKFGWAMVVRPDILFISVGFSALIGIVFGLYPAHRASRLDPIDALRYE